LTHQVVLVDHLAPSFEQDRQDLQGFAGEGDRLSAAFE
jgi:hypothetical protein